MKTPGTRLLALFSALTLAGLLGVGSSPAMADPIDHSVGASLISLTRDSAAEVAPGDAVAFTWTTQDVSPTSVTIEITDSLGLTRNLNWYPSESPVMSGSATSTVSAQWAGGTYSVSLVVVRWENGILRYKPDGSVERFPSTLTVVPADLGLASSGFSVAPVAGSPDPSVAASLVSLDRASSSTPAAGSTISFQWSVEDTPAESVSVELLDPLGQSRLVTWRKSAAAALSGTAQATTDNTWPSGKYEIHNVFVRWPSGTLRYNANGSVQKSPTTLSVEPSDFDLSVEGFTLGAGGSDPNLSVGASLVSVVRNSSSTVRDGSEVSYSWSTQGTAANIVTIELTGPLGMTRYLNWVSPNAASSGTITGTVNASTWPLGKYAVTRYTVRWPNGILTYRANGTTHQYPSTVQHTLPSTLKFVGFEVALPGTLTSTPQPTIAGDALIGSTLTATPGQWQPAPVAISYQWLRGDTPIAGAVWSTYKLTSSDGGSPISVAVTGSKTGYTSVVQTSAPTAPVSGGTLTASFPTLSGMPAVGETLTVVPGAWGPDPVTLSYQWNRDGVAVVGATSTTYLLTEDDGGRRITATVTGTKPGYTDRSRTTSNSGVVLRRLTATPTPTISGTGVVGGTLVGNGSGWAPATVTLAYQWNRNDTPIAGATAANYTVVAADSGTSLTLTVTGTKPGYVSETRTSAPIAVG